MDVSTFFLKTYDKFTRHVLSRIMCGIAFEHAESIKILIASENFTSALGLFQLQYESQNSYRGFGSTPRVYGKQLETAELIHPWRH